MHNQENEAAGSLRHFKEVTLSVMAGYVSSKALPCLVAQQIDPNPVTRSCRKTLVSIEYTVDVEHQTEKALCGDAILERAWFRIASGERVEPDIANRVYLKCGRIYAARGLEPWTYFRRNKYAHRKAGRTSEAS